MANNYPTLDIEFTYWICPLIIVKNVRVSTFQTRSITPTDPLSKYLPSLVKAKERIPFVCPLQMPIYEKLFRFHNFIDQSSAPLARVFPTGEKATVLTADVCPVNVPARVIYSILSRFQIFIV